MIRMSDKRIVLIRNAAPQDFGGGERFPVFLSEILQSEGYSPIIVSHNKKLLTFAQERKQETITGWWWRKQQWSGLNNLLLPFYFIWQIALYTYYICLFSKIKPLAVHIQSKDDFIAATYAARTFGIKTVWTDHADLKHVWKNVTAPWKNTIGKLVLHAAHSADTVTVVSKSEEALITQHLLTESPVRNKITVIYNGVVDTAVSYNGTPKEDVCHFLVASRLVTDKGIGEVVTAFSKLHAQHPDTKLTLIGDGPEADKFKRQASKLDSVHFLGHQSDPLSFMAEASVFVHPTYHEGFSVALVEAGMMSLPIIATSIGGNVEIIKHEETGLLVSVRDSEALYSAMNALYLDKELREKLAKNARTQYEQKYQFNEIVSQQFIPLYGGSHEN